ncbi:MAG TPA: cupin domain-containing protein [Candidatus Nitrosotenuis sp.]|jgi:mannose-6-phosphate isomerase-like protein (cupin superfamily)
MKIEFDVKKYIDEIKNSDEYFHTFIDRANIAAGVLVLEPGEEDTQAPHDSDELYYVIRGDGFLKINNKDYEISEGKAYYVQKDVPHKFFGNKKEIVALYFFSGHDS